jgi:hypothetical protein
MRFLISELSSFNLRWRQRFEGWPFCSYVPFAIPSRPELDQARLLKGWTEFLLGRVLPAETRSFLCSQKFRGAQRNVTKTAGGDMMGKDLAVESKILPIGWIPDK